jgi:AraC-like DNA-binding protein
VLDSAAANVAAAVVTTESPRQSVIASYAHAIFSALELRGIDARAVFREAEVAVPTRPDPLARLGNAEVGRLFAAAIRATGDPYIGIAVGSLLQPGYLHALGYGLMASASLRDFCQRVCNYYRLASQNADFRTYAQDGAFVLEGSHIAADTCFETQDVFVVLMVRYMRFLCQRELDPLRLELLRPCPAPGAQPYLDYFRCPVSFGAPMVRLAIDERVVDDPLPGSNPELALQNDQVVIRYLERLDRSDVVTAVRSLIIAELTVGACKQGIAKRLHMSARNLQGKLAARGTTFQDVLDSTRHQLALGYIDQRAVAIKEITYLLGFSDAAAFTRAFRRWTGKSPSEYRSAAQTLQRQS